MKVSIYDSAVVALVELINSHPRSPTPKEIKEVLTREISPKHALSALTYCEYILTQPSSLEVKLAHIRDQLKKLGA